jgi:hypothetical protein
LKVVLFIINFMDDNFIEHDVTLLPLPLPASKVHCINSKSYNAQESVFIHSGPDSKVMQSLTTRMCFSQSSVMMMDTSPVHRIWHA